MQVEGKGKKGKVKKKCMYDKHVQKCDVSLGQSTCFTKNVPECIQSIPLKNTTQFNLLLLFYYTLNK